METTKLFTNHIALQAEGVMLCQSADGSLYVRTGEIVNGLFRPHDQVYAVTRGPRSAEDIQVFCARNGIPLQDNRVYR